MGRNRKELGLKKEEHKTGETEKSLIRRKVNFYLNKVGKRSFLSESKIRDFICESFYRDKFRQGATIVPRNFWFVEIEPQPRLGIDLNSPSLETSKEVKKVAKDAYKDVRISGKVNRRFLYATLRGSEVVPFSHLPFKLVVLPTVVEEGMFRMLDEEEAGRKGHSDLAKWIKKAEENWEERKKERIKLTVIERLNYQNELVNQDPSTKYKVLYLTSGKNIAACMLDLEKEKLEMEVDNERIPLAEFVADCMTYHYETENKEEALYLTAMLNSPAVNSLIKDMQTKGLFGERHIHKKVLDLPISKYNHEDPTHKELVKLAEKCIEKSEQRLPELIKKYKSIARIRRDIKNELSKKLSKVSDLSLQVLCKVRKNGPTLNSLIK